MNFDLDPEQSLMREYARTYLEKVCPSTHVRAMEAEAAGYSRQTYADLGERGWIGILADTEVGGVGKGPIEWSVLAAEVGRALLPGPYLATAVIGTQAVAAIDVTDARLRDVVSGRLIVADALFDDARAERMGVRTRAAATRDGFVLQGEKRFVQYGQSVDVLAVLARDSDTVDASLSLHLIPVDAPGLRATPLVSVGGEPLYQIVLDDVMVAGVDSFGPGPEVEKLVKSISDLSRLGTAAALVGMSRKLFDLSLAHAQMRRQFGRAIGTFQVIQHQLVDLYSEVERAQVLLNKAAWLMSEGKGYARDLAVARCAASDTSYLASHTAGHVYGGYGFMSINDVQLYYRRPKVLELRYGNADACRSEIADLGYLPAFELPESDFRTIPQLAMFGSTR